MSVLGIKPKSKKRQVSPPQVSATIVMCTGLLLAWLFAPGGLDATDSASIAAQIVFATLCLAFLLEFMSGAKNLLRLDLLMILALFGLSLLEFLFDQPNFNRLITQQATLAGVNVVLLGMATLAVSRHVPFSYKPSKSLQLKPRAIRMSMVVCFVLGFSYMMVSVGFNPLRLVSEMMEPRFSQSWTRGRLGGLSGVLHEIQLLLYLVPALGGLIEARKQRFSTSSKWLARGLVAFTLFYGLSTGTRNIFFVFAMTYVVAYILAYPRMTRARLVQLGVVSLLVLAVTSQLALEFRRVGLQRYVASLVSDETVPEPNLGTAFFVDYNLLTLGKLIQEFDRTDAFLGWEVPIWAITKPIPRILWPSKPEGLSISIEQTRRQQGASAATWAATYLGEAYMAAGHFGVVLASVFFGVWGAWWNSRARAELDEYSILMYAAGVFAALISMRSLFWFTTALLPLIALGVLFRLSNRGKSPKSPKRRGLQPAVSAG